MLEGVTEGIINLPHLVLVYGEDGTGKTTFGSLFPKPIFLGPESGSNRIKNAQRFTKIKTYKDIIAKMDLLLKDKHDRQTLVIDSLDWIEPLIIEEVVLEKNAKDFEDLGGFGKGEIAIADEWRKSFLARITKLREEKNMNVIMICHHQLKPFNPPDASEPYDRYSLKLSKKTASLFREFADSVFFISEEVLVNKKKGASKAKAFSDGSLYIHTKKTIAFDAKNRFGMPGKFEYIINGFYEKFEQLIKESEAPEQADILKQEILDLLLEIKDQETVKNINISLEKVGNNTAGLTRIKDKMQTIINEGN